MIKIVENDSHYYLSLLYTKSIKTINL